MILNPLRLAIAGGAVWALAMVFTTVLSLGFNYGTGFLNIMSGVYPGYDITWPGVIIGAVYGFFDGFFGMYILAWIYNKLGGHHKSKI